MPELVSAMMFRASARDGAAMARTTTMAPRLHRKRAHSGRSFGKAVGLDGDIRADAPGDGATAHGVHPVGTSLWGHAALAGTASRGAAHQSRRPRACRPRPGVPSLAEQAPWPRSASCRAWRARACETGAATGSDAVPSVSERRAAETATQSPGPCAPGLTRGFRAATALLPRRSQAKLSARARAQRSRSPRSGDRPRQHAVMRGPDQGVSQQGTQLAALPGQQRWAQRSAVPR